MKTVMNLIVGLLFAALGTFFTLRPRALCWLHWTNCFHDREPTRVELLLARVVGVTIAIGGLALALLNP